MTDWKSPCIICGYNGPRFFEPTVHPCMAHGSERGALLAEIASLKAEVETLSGALERIKDADESISSAKHMASSAYTAHRLRAKKLGAMKASI